MRIVILRHGEATLSNCDRVLSSQGMKEAVATGQKLSKILTITKCFCSPKTRTEQTANIVCQQLGFDGNKETSLLKILQTADQRMYAQKRKK